MLLLLLLSYVLISHHLDIIGLGGGGGLSPTYVCFIIFFRSNFGTRRERGSEEEVMIEKKTVLRSRTCVSRAELDILWIDWITLLL